MWDYPQFPIMRKGPQALERVAGHWDFTQQFLVATYHARDPGGSGWTLGLQKAVSSG